jgi:uncharacterized protein YceH (UPF0502 family)
VALPRRPGERGQRYAHRLAQAGAEAPPADEPPASELPASELPAAPSLAPAESPPAESLPASGDGLADRVDRLEGEVAVLRELVDSLRAELGA